MSDVLVMLGVLRAKIVQHLDTIPPPYLFPDAVDEPFPTMCATTIGEVLHDVWHAAHEQILEIIDGAIEFEQAKGPGRTDVDGKDRLYVHMRENEETEGGGTSVP